MSVTGSLILLVTRPHPKKARNTRDIKNCGMQFECVNYYLLNRSYVASDKVTISIEINQLTV